jgi:3-oxoadipate enol-lactonase
MPYADANGVRLYYEQEGSGPDLVLIMGLGAHLGAWALQRPDLSRHFRVTAFDNRGAGRSDAPDEPYSIAGMADDTVALMTSLGIARAHVVGASMGGMIAQELAIRHPDRVDGLVLACTRAKAGPLRELMAPVDRWLREQGLDRIQLALLTMPWGRTAAFMSDQEKVLKQLELVRMDPYPMQLHAYLRQHSAVMAHDTLGRLGSIRARTLVLVGAEDVLTPPAESRVLAAAIPGARLVELPRGGHGFTGEYPDEFNAAVIDFLKM